MGRFFGPRVFDREELDRHARLVPRNAVMDVVNMRLPGYVADWVKEEAERRDIPFSWLVTELLDRGIEAYHLSGAPDGDEMVEGYRKGGL